MTAGGLLDQGVARGIISAEQADQLRALEAGQVQASRQQIEPNGPAPTPDDESLRFIGGFSDVFVVLGILMFVGSLAYLAVGLGAPATWAIVAITSWLLAEFFTRKRRMAFPSIVLLILFVLSVFQLCGLLLALMTGPAEPVSFRDAFSIDHLRPSRLIGAALLTVGFAALHYRRFQVPITIAAGCAALACAVVGVIYSLSPDVAQYSIVTLICGIAIFALAMRFDISDPERLTRQTDIAFWLHLLASPLIVHSLIGGMLTRSSLEPAMAGTIIAIFLALGFVAVMIDRRAMLVSGLAYAGYAFAVLIREAGISTIATPATILALGAFVLLLSAGWRPLRQTIVKAVPQAITRRLPKTSAMA